jgi:hypothetical protein
MATIRLVGCASRKVTISVLLAEILFLILVLAIHPQKPPFLILTGQGELRSHTQSTGDVAFTLGAGAFHTFKFVVPGEHTNASLKGAFSVTGNTRAKSKPSSSTKGIFRAGRMETPRSVSTTAGTCGKARWMFRFPLIRTRIKWCSIPGRLWMPRRAFEPI